MPRRRASATSSRLSSETRESPSCFAIWSDSSMKAAGTQLLSFLSVRLRFASDQAGFSGEGICARLRYVRFSGSSELLSWVTFSCSSSKPCLSKIYLISSMLAYSSGLCLDIPDDLLVESPSFFDFNFFGLLLGIYLKTSLYFAQVFLPLCITAKS